MESNLKKTVEKAMKEKTDTNETESLSTQNLSKKENKKTITREQITSSKEDQSAQTKETAHMITNNNSNNKTRNIKPQNFIDNEKSKDRNVRKVKSSVGGTSSDKKCSTEPKSRDKSKSKETESQFADMGRKIDEYINHINDPFTKGFASSKGSSGKDFALYHHHGESIKSNFTIGPSNSGTSKSKDRKNGKLYASCKEKTQSIVSTDNCMIDEIGNMNISINKIRNRSPGGKVDGNTTDNKGPIINISDLLTKSQAITCNKTPKERNGSTKKCIPKLELHKQVILFVYK